MGEGCDPVVFCDCITSFLLYLLVNFAKKLYLCGFRNDYRF